MWHFYNFLALTFYRWQWYFLAEFAAYHAVLEAKEIFGVNDNRTKKSVDDLLDIYKALDKKHDAEELIKDSIVVWENSKGSDHLDVLELYEKLNKLQGNEPIHEPEPIEEILKEEKEEVQSSAKDGLDSSWENVIPSPEKNKKAVARSLINLAMFYGVQNKYDEAVNLINYALSIWDGKDKINVENIVNEKLLGAEDAVIKLIEEPMSPLPYFPVSEVAQPEKFEWPRKSRKSLTV